MNKKQLLTHRKLEIVANSNGYITEEGPTEEGTEKQPQM